MKYPDGMNREQWLANIEVARNPFYAYPDNIDQRIWRYMDFAKFVGLIDAGALFFPGASRLNDSFEGSVSEENLRRRPGQIDDMVEQFRTGFPGHPLTPEDEARMRNDLRVHQWVMARQLEWERHWTYISCWHLNDYESAAMWRCYAASNQAIAVQSTFRRLHVCLRAHVQPPMGEPLLGKVYYADYGVDVVPRNVHLSEFFYKRKSFAHEAEVRAVMQDLAKVPASYDSEKNVTGWHYDYARQPEPGRSLAVDLDQLIEAIYVAPSAPAWLSELTARITAKYGLEKPIHHSGLDASPVY
jgi:hypothetical protein